MKAILGLIALALIGGGAVMLTNGNGATSTTTAEAGGQTLGGLISPAAYVEQFSETAHFLLDVRTPGEFAGGHIAGAANIAVEVLGRNLSAVPHDQPIVLYCRSGNRSAEAARILRNAGYTAVYDLGGIIDWTAQGFPVIR